MLLSTKFEICVLKLERRVSRSALSVRSGSKSELMYIFRSFFVKSSEVELANRYFNLMSRAKLERVGLRLDLERGVFGMNFGPKPRSCLVPGGIVALVQKL